MTTVEVLYSYGMPLTEKAARAVARARDVYGMRRVAVDSAARTIRVEYDATRLKPAAIAKLLLAAGVDVLEELPLVPPPAPEPAPAA